MVSPATWISCLALLGLGLGCGAPTPPAGTGGVSLAMGRCGRGLAVVQSDYQSSNVTLTDLSGKVVSSSFISSASSDTALSAPLSGDVIVPTAVNLSDELVLVDRYPASVLTWVMLETAEVRAQLEVGTGFAANPQDYLPLGDDKAYVSRYESNPLAGREAYDEGGDVLVIDPRAPAIVGRIDMTPAMADAPGFLPRVGRMVALDRRVFVLLLAYSADFVTSAPSRIVTLDADSDTIVGVTVLDGLHGCWGLALGPRRDEAGQPFATPALAVSCPGSFGGDASATVAEAGLVVLSTEPAVPVEVVRHMADALVGQPLGAGLDFVSPDRLLVTTMGSFADGNAPAQPDRLLEVSVTDGLAREVLRSDSQPFELGELRCATMLDVQDPADDGCGACFLADGERTRLARLVDDGLEVAHDASIEMDHRIGLPPRGVGRF